MAASTLPLHHARADYTYAPPLKAYTMAQKQQTASSSPADPCASDELAAQANTTQSPPRTAALFQSKLQRALWLDQRATCAHEESSARAGLRCREAEARDAIWWPYQHEKALLCTREDYSARTSALLVSQLAREQHVETARVAKLLKQEEPEARRAVEMEAATSLQLLSVAESTHALELSALRIKEEREQAEAVAATAREVRELELALATRSYHATPAFNPFVGDLTHIAEGLASPPTHSATPLEQWRERYPRQSSLSGGMQTGGVPASSPSSSGADQSTVKGMELYARRSLRYDEEKERLLHHWWEGVGTLWHLHETEERRRLWDLYAFVVSPGRMHAVVVLQRWWKVVRNAPWSQHRRERLALSLSRMPQWHSAAQYKRRLRALEGATAMSDSSDCHRGPESTISDDLQALVTSATHPRRYVLQLSLYVHSCARKARAFCAGVGMPASCLTGINNTEQEVRRDTDWHAAAPHMWSQMHWQSYATPSSTELRQDGATVPPTSHPINADKQHTHASCGETARGDAAPLGPVQAAQQALTAEAAESRLRVVRQEEHERRVWTSRLAASRPLSEHLHEHSGAIPSPLREGVQQRSLGPKKTAAGARKGAPSCLPGAEMHDGLAKAERCVQQACDLYATLQRDTEKAAAAGAPKSPVRVSAMVQEDAAQQYSSAFDEAAALVYSEQYTTVQQRFSALNAELLGAMQAIVRDVLNEKIAVIVEENEAHERLILGNPSGCWISQLQLTSAEAAERREVCAAQVRETEILVEAFHDGLSLLRLI